MLLHCTCSCMNQMFCTVNEDKLQVRNSVVCNVLRNMLCNMVGIKHCPPHHHPFPPSAPHHLTGLRHLTHFRCQDPSHHKYIHVKDPQKSTKNSNFFCPTILVHYTMPEPPPPPHLIICVNTNLVYCLHNICNDPGCVHFHCNKGPLSQFQPQIACKHAFMLKMSGS